MNIMLFSNIFLFTSDNPPLISSLQTSRAETWDDKTQHASFIAMLEALSFTIDRVASEVIRNKTSLILLSVKIKFHRG